MTFLLPDMIEAQTPAAPAIAFEGETITYARLVKDAARISGWLAARGVGPGDRVAWLGLNHPDMLRLLLACHRLGAIFTPLNSRLAREEYRFLLQDAAPRVCVHDPDFAHVAAALAGEAPFAPQHALGEPADPAPKADIEADAPLLLVYTSGTTGRPKGVLLSRRAVAANIENSQDIFRLKPGDTVMITLPLFHVGGLCILLLPALCHGGRLILRRRFDPDETMRDLADPALRTTVLVPAQMAMLMSRPDWETTRFPGLEFLIVGSSVVPHWQIRKFHDRNIPVVQVYGATETGPGAIALRPEDAMAHLGAVGRDMKLCRTRIVRPDGSDCGAGEPGEVIVKGPNVMSGYWRNPEGTAQVLNDGWYRTGDMGVRDAEGFVTIVDRIKDVVISGGENIYPAEVEMVAALHPAIAAIAVIGRADPKWGETPVAVVELNEGAALTLAEFHDWLKDRLARFKQPKDLIVVEALPRNSLGKVEKAKLRAAYG